MPGMPGRLGATALMILASAVAASACQNASSNTPAETTSTEPEAQPAPLPQEAGVHTVVLDVGGVSCAGCNLTIRNALMHLDGVRDLRGHQDDKRRLDVDYEAATVAPQQIATLLTEAGYETSISGVLTEPDAS
jgi:copper chaperone CopZ